MYNHESFIKRAMEGVLAQKTDFGIEIVIGDDFSTDRTLDIVRSFRGNDRIRIKILDRKKGDDYFINRQKNGRMFNFYDLLNNCQGKFIALLDGDDYWTDPYKLQKQVEFLRENPTYSAVAHNAQMLYHNWNSAYSIQEARKKNEEIKTKDGIHGLFSSKKTIQDINLTEILYKWPIQTSVFLFKTSILKHLPVNFKSMPHGGDQCIFLCAKKEGDIVFLPDVSSVYRIHASGANNIEQGYKSFLEKAEMISSFKMMFNSENSLFNHLISHNYFQAAILSDNLNIRLNSLAKAIYFDPKSIHNKLRMIVSILIRSFYKS